MPTFPVTYSTLAAISLEATLSQRYMWDNVQCRLLLRGVSDTYSVSTSSGKFVLRIYRAGHRILSEIEVEVEFLIASKKSGVSVSYPVPDGEGHYVFTVDAPEGTRHGVVFTRAPGKFVPLLNDKQIVLFGREMARLHTISTNVRLVNQRWSINCETTLIRPLAAIKDYFYDYPDEYAWLQKVAEQTQDRISQFDRSAFVSGYCHFDFFPKNVHFVNDDSLTFFDFDFLGYGWIVNDVMTFQQHLFLEVEMGRMSESTSEKVFKLFVDAYREIRSLSEEELAAVPVLSLGFWLFYFGFYTTHDQFLPLLHNPHLTARTNLIRQIMKRSSRLK